SYETRRLEPTRASLERISSNMQYQQQYELRRCCLCLEQRSATRESAPKQTQQQQALQRCTGQTAAGAAHTLLLESWGDPGFVVVARSVMATSAELALLEQANGAGIEPLLRPRLRLFLRLTTSTAAPATMMATRAMATGPATKGSCTMDMRA